MKMGATVVAGGREDASLPGLAARAAAHPALAGTSRPQPRRWWILSGIVLVGLIVCASLAAILNSRERALTNAERQLQNLAFVLASQATATFETIDRVQASLVEQIAAAGIHSAQEFEEKFTNIETHLMLKDKHLGLPHVGAFSLVNAEGKIFNFSRSWPVRQIDVSDREFFQVLKADQTRTSFISEPIRKRATGEWIIPLARTIRTVDGKFAGLLLAAVDVAQFEREFQPIVLGEHGSIALLRDNGVLLARYPRIESIVGQTFRAPIHSPGQERFGSGAP